MHANTNHFCPVTGNAIDLGRRLVSVRLLEQFRVVSILKLSQGPLEKEDLMQMLETSIEEVERAVTLLAGRGIIRVDPGEKPERDLVTL